MPEGAPKNGAPEGDPRDGVPEGAPGNSAIPFLVLVHIQTILLGFGRSAFTDEQLEKLKSFVGN